MPTFPLSSFNVIHQKKEKYILDCTTSGMPHLYHRYSENWVDSLKYITIMRGIPKVCCRRGKIWKNFLFLLKEVHLLLYGGERCVIKHMEMEFIFWQWEKILNSTVDILFDRKGIDEKWMETDVLNFYLRHFREKRCGSYEDVSVRIFLWYLKNEGKVLKETL